MFDVSPYLVFARLFMALSIFGIIQGAFFLGRTDGVDMWPGLDYFLLMVVCAIGAVFLSVMFSISDTDCWAMFLATWGASWLGRMKRIEIEEKEVEFEKRRTAWQTFSGFFMAVAISVIACLLYMLLMLVLVGWRIAG